MTAEPKPRTITPTMVETASGRFLDLAKPDPNDIRIEDVAHHLSMICRFCGATSRFFSVAEHSVNVSLIAEYIATINRDTWSSEHPNTIGSIALYALLHDTHEAFVGDVPRPKQRAEEDDTWYDETALNPQCPVARTMQTCALTALIPARLNNGVTGFERFDLDQIVTAADDRALRIEADALLLSRGRNWSFEDEELPFFADAQLAHVHIQGMSPALARDRFLARYRFLTTEPEKGV